MILSNSPRQNRITVWIKQLLEGIKQTELDWELLQDFDERQYYYLEALSSLKILSVAYSNFTPGARFVDPRRSINIDPQKSKFLLPVEPFPWNLVAEKEEHYINITISEVFWVASWLDLPISVNGNIQSNFKVTKIWNLNSFKEIAKIHENRLNATD